jgi:hypothetical protein
VDPFTEVYRKVVVIMLFILAFQPSENNTGRARRFYKLLIPAFHSSMKELCVRAVTNTASREEWNTFHATLESTRFSLEAFPQEDTISPSEESESGILTPGSSSSNPIEIDEDEDEEYEPVTTPNDTKERKPLPTLESRASEWKREREKTRQMLKEQKEAKKTEYKKRFEEKWPDPRKTSGSNLGRYKENGVIKEREVAVMTAEEEGEFNELIEGMDDKVVIAMVMFANRMK